MDIVLIKLRGGALGGSYSLGNVEALCLVSRGREGGEDEHTRVLIRKETLSMLNLQ